MPISVAICDNHPLYLSALNELIEEAPLLELTGAAESGSECLQLLRERRPQACVIDVTVGHVDGIGLLSTATRERLPSRLLVLSDCSEPNIVYKALAWVLPAIS